MDDRKEIYGVISKIPLFQDISEDKYRNIFNCLNAYTKFYNKKELITDLEEPIKHAGIVISGEVCVSLINKNGYQHSIKHYTQGELFGEVQACTDNNNENILIEATLDSKILFLNLSQLFSAKAKRCSYASIVSVNLLREMLDINVFLSKKIEILSQKRIRERLIIYFKTLIENSDDSKVENSQEYKSFSIPLKRHDLASFLGVDRSALSRELSEMRDDGLILFDGNIVKILDLDIVD